MDLGTGDGVGHGVREGPTLLQWKLGCRTQAGGEGSAEVFNQDCGRCRQNSKLSPKPKVREARIYLAGGETLSGFVIEPMGRKVNRRYRKDAPGLSRVTATGQVMASPHSATRVECNMKL